MIKVAQNGCGGVRELKKQRRVSGLGVVFILTKGRSGLRRHSGAKGYVRPGLSLESLAREVGCNRSYLSRYVNSELGLNFKSWIRALRIAESQRLLLEHPGASALEVGEMVGIHGRSTFFAQFSEVTGMSPGEYRRRYAGGHIAFVLIR